MILEKGNYVKMLWERELKTLSTYEKNKSLIDKIINKINYERPLKEKESHKLKNIIIKEIKREDMSEEKKANYKYMLDNINLFIEFTKEMDIEDYKKNWPKTMNNSYSKIRASGNNKNEKSKNKFSKDQGIVSNEIISNTLEEKNIKTIILKTIQEISENKARIFKNDVFDVFFGKSDNKKLINITTYNIFKNLNKNRINKLFNELIMEEYIGFIKKNGTNNIIKITLYGEEKLKIKGSRYFKIRSKLDFNEEKEKTYNKSLNIGKENLIKKITIKPKEINYKELQEKYPDKFIFIKNRFFYSIYGEKAKQFASLMDYNYKEYKDGNIMTGFPSKKLDEILEILKMEGLKTLVVDYKKSNKTRKKYSYDYENKSKEKVESNKEPKKKNSKKSELLKYSNEAIIELLSRGINPITGENFDDKHFMNNNRIKESLKYAHTIINKKEKIKELNKKEKVKESNKIEGEVIKIEILYSGKILTLIEDGELKQAFINKKLIRKLDKLELYEVYSIEGKIKRDNGVKQICPDTIDDIKKTE